MTQPRQAIPRLLYRLGTPLANAGQVTYEFLAWSGEALRSTGAALFQTEVIVERFFSLMVKSWVLVVITSFATGAAMALQFGEGMSRFGGKLYVPNVVAFAIVKALGPVFACLMVSARSGGGVAAELGSMQVTQQIDALKALGANPYEKLVAPILIAFMCGMPLLTFLADVAGIAGGLLASYNSLNIAPALYLQKTIDSVSLRDLVVSLAKTSLFGGVISLICCFLGMRTRVGTSGIGIATTSAIVAANIFVLVADLLFTKLLWILKW
jgi:phospholipid/cholesterol/gamma-HCH transport system permease protein